MIYRTLPLLLLALVFGGCDLGGGKSDPPTVVFGWRSAGLVLPDADNTGGLHRLVNIGNHIFVMDAYTPGYMPGQAEDGKFYHWRVWQGNVGSDVWDSLPMPNGNTPSEWIVIGDFLYIGMKYTGEVWRYDPNGAQWAQIKLPTLPVSPQNWNFVLFLGSYQGELVVGEGAMGSNQSLFWMGGVKDTIGQSIAGTGVQMSYPQGRAVEFDGYLYGISEQFGVYRWKTGQAAWQLLESPRGRNDSMVVDPCALAAAVVGYTGALSCPETKVNTETEMVSAIGVHDGHLFVGYDSYQAGLWRMESDGSWTSVTPLQPKYEVRDAPRDIRVILSYQSRFFMAGVSGSSVMI